MRKFLFLVSMMVGLYFYTLENHDAVNEGMQENIGSAELSEEKIVQPELVVSILDEKETHLSNKIEVVNLGDEAGGPTWVEQARQIQVHFATGGYGKALELADRHLSDKDSASQLLDWIYRELPTLLDHAAWAHLRLGRCQEAIKLFSRVMELRKTIDNSYGFSFCARKLGRMQQAYEHLSWNISQQPDHRVSWLLYAEVLESLRDFDGATIALKEASDLKRDPDLELKIQAMRHRAEAQGEQRHEQSDFYRISWPMHVPIDGAELIRWVDAAFRDLLERGYRPPKAAIEIFLYEKEDFSDLVPGVPGWVDGLFDGRLRIPIHHPPQPKRLRSVIRHELSHALLSHMSDGRRLPPWWDEGVAQRASCGREGCEAFEYPSGAERFFPDMKTLVTSFTSMEAKDARQAYKASEFMIRWLEKKDPEAWKKMLESVTHNSKVDSKSLLEPYGRSFEELYQEAKVFWQSREHL